MTLYGKHHNPASPATRIARAALFTGVPTAVGLGLLFKPYADQPGGDAGLGLFLALATGVAAGVLAGFLRWQTIPASDLVREVVGERVVDLDALKSDPPNLPLNDVGPLPRHAFHMGRDAQPIKRWNDRGDGFYGNHFDASDLSTDLRNDWAARR